MKAVFLDYATVSSAELNMDSLRGVLPELQLFEHTTPGQLAARTADAQYIITNKVRLTRDFLNRATKLKFVGIVATGVDIVDLAAASKNSIAVSNIKGYCTRSVTEHVFAVLLGLSHNIARYGQSVRAGEWQKSASFCLLDHPIRELSAMTIGIVGYGELGRSVARMARHFGMSVLIARRHGEAPVADDGRTDFSELLAQCDVISLHCPLNKQTRGLIGTAELRLMKPSAILINTARGGLLDSGALAQALAQGEIYAAAIDVLSQEPPLDGDPLLEYQGDNLILTPHIAWGTAQGRQNAVDEVAANITAFQAGEKRNRVA